jgi:TolA-binding protein
MKLYSTVFGLLLSVATVSAAESDTPLLAPSTSLAPAAVHSPTDSLPDGRHKVSSYRNGESIEVVVEGREIKSLKVDGKEVPEAEYNQHQDRVEELLGTNENSRHSNHQIRMYRGSDSDDLEGLEERFEGMGEHFEKMGEKFELRFEGMGEDLERLGERMGESFERMFSIEGDGKVMRFEFRTDEDGNWDMDSLGEGRTFEWHSDGMGIKGLNSEMPAIERNQAEAEIREMETMIEQMERQKSRMKADLERQERDLERQQRDLERQGRDIERQGRDVEREVRRTERVEVRKERMERREASYEVLVNQLQREGLIEDSGRLRKLSVDGENLKVNGKKASKEGHARFLELYEQQTGKKFGSNTSISIKMD